MQQIHFSSRLALLLAFVISYIEAYSVVPATWVGTDLVLVGTRVVVNTNQQMLSANYTATVPYPNGKVYSSNPQVATAVHRYLGTYNVS